MKMLVAMLAILGSLTLSSRAALHAGSGGGGGHGSAGVFHAHGSSGTVHLNGGHFHGGPFFYGGFYGSWYYPYPYYYSYYPGSYYSPPTDSASGTGQAYSPSGPSYDELGRFWGDNLKHRTGTREQLIEFIHSDLSKASDSGRALFRGGFLKTYKEGAPIVDQALSETQQPKS